MKEYKADMHIHSKYSFDSVTEIRDIINAASDNGLKYVAITDHVEFSNQPVKEVLNRIRMRNQEIDEIQSSTNIKIIKGLEVSEPHNYHNEMFYLEELEDIDYIIGSIHHILGMPIGKMKKNKNAIALYLSSMLNMVTNEKIDTLAHLDYIKKYLSPDIIDEPLLKEILAVIVEKGIALEINTSGVRRGTDFFPNSEIVNIYKSLGGRNITIGSDAHELNEINDHIPELLESGETDTLTKGIVLKRTFRPLN